MIAEANKSIIPSSHELEINESMIISQQRAEKNSLQVIKNDLVESLGRKGRELINPDRMLIGEILVDLGKLSKSQVENILQEQNNLRRAKTPRLFGEISIQKGFIDKTTLLHALSVQYGYSTPAFIESKLDRSLFAAYQPYSKEAENYRRIRVTLFEWFVRNKIPLCVVSLDQADGRSHFVSNLAITLSQAGKKVLLIDADLRNSKLQKLFSVDNSCGLTGLLSGQSIGDVLYNVDSLTNLTILPSGPTPPNPQELLSQPLFRLLLENSTEKYDIILIDTPSVSNCGDAELIAAISGAAIILARKNRTRTNELKDLYKRLKTMNVSIAGTIMNCY